PGARGRKLAQVDLRGLVRAVLRPERGGDPQLGPRGIAAEDRAQLLVLLARQAALRGERRVDHRLVRPPRGGGGGRRNARLAHARTSLKGVSEAAVPASRARPSELPSSASTERSGCGIRPSTLPCSLAMPAIARAAPFGFSSWSNAQIEPSGSQ